MAASNGLLRAITEKPFNFSIALALSKILQHMVTLSPSEAYVTAGLGHE